MRLGNLIADWRWRNRIGIREVAKQIGISSSSLSRIENGRSVDSRTMTKLMLWAFADESDARRKP